MLLNYRIIGSGKPVFFLHGFLENNLMWDSIAKELQNSYTCILPDLPGHGKSENIASSHTMPLVAEKIFELMDHLGLPSAAVIGHSMGGYVALEMLHQKPKRVEKICMFFSHPLPDSDEKKQQRLEAAETAEKNPKRFIELGIRGLFAENNLNNLKEEIKTATTWALKNDYTGIKPALLGMRERVDRSDVLETAEVPVHFILGEFDSAVDLSKTLDIVPDKDIFRINILPVGHMGHLEAPNESLELITDFLQS